MWWVRQGAIQEWEFHCPLGTHRESQYCPFQRKYELNCLKKPQNKPKGGPLTRADGLLPGSSQLCDHAALLLPKMAWFMPEGTLSPQIFSAPSCTWNVKSYKTSHLSKHHQTAVCNTATMWSQGAMHGKRDSASWFPKASWKGTSQVGSCDVAFLGPAERAHVRAGEEGRRVYPIPGLLPSSVCNRSTI